MTTAVDMFPETMSAPEEVPNERYTTRAALALCMRKAFVTAFDLDVAACEESHKAPEWFGVEQNGLERPWHGRVWCNPPYDNIGPWVEKAWEEHSAGRAECIAMLLPATRTEQPWWQECVEPYRDDNYPTQELVTHFLPGRISFGAPGNPEAIGVGSPKFGCVLLVWRQS